MNTKIVAILMAGIVAMAVAVPMAIGDNATTSATVNDVASTYDCSGTSITAQPDPTTDTNGTVNFELVVNDNNGADTIPDTGWKAKVTFTSSLDTTDNVSLSVTNVNTTADKFTGTEVVPHDTVPDTYTVYFYDPDGALVCTKDVTVGEVISISVTDMNFGNVNPGDATNPGHHNVNNTGNVEIKFVDQNSNGYDVEGNDGIIWADMAGSGTAAGETIEDGQLTTTWSAAATIAVNANADVNFNLDVPTALKSGPYAGSTTFTPTKA